MSLKIDSKRTVTLKVGKDKHVLICFNIFSSGIKDTEKDWVLCKVRQYPLQKGKEEVQKHKTQIWTTQYKQRKKKEKHQPPLKINKQTKNTTTTTTTKNNTFTHTFTLAGSIWKYTRSVHYWVCINWATVREWQRKRDGEWQRKRDGEWQRKRDGEWKTKLGCWVCIGLPISIFFFHRGTSFPFLQGLLTCVYPVPWFKHFAVLVQGQLVTCPSKY